jgi:hypothetical protein
MRSRQAGEAPSGKAGRFSEDAIWKSAEIGESRSLHGALPHIISITCTRTQASETSRNLLFTRICCERNKQRTLHSRPASGHKCS